MKKEAKLKLVVLRSNNLPENERLVVFDDCAECFDRWSKELL